jgi:hypothetical protein
MDMLLWTSTKEEVCRGRGTARSRLFTPYDRSKEARRSARSAGRWEYHRRQAESIVNGENAKDPTTIKSGKVSGGSSMVEKDSANKKSGEYEKQLNSAREEAKTVSLQRSGSSFPDTGRKHVMT